MRRPIGFRIEHADDEADLRTRSMRAIRAGFDGIELPVPPVASFGHGEMGIAPNSFLTDPARAKLSVLAVAARCTTCRLDLAIEQVRVLLNHAADLHAHCLNLSIPPLEGRGEALGFPRYQQALNFVYRLLYEARHEAESTGVAIALEAPADGCFLSPVELRETLHHANSCAVGACIDLHRVARVGSPADWLATLGHQVRSVRIRDLLQVEPNTPRGWEQPFDVAAITAALREIPCNTPIIASGSAEPARIRAHLTSARPAHPG